MGYLKRRRSAFGFAFSGLLQAFSKEAHMKLHGCAAILVTALGFYFELTAGEWIAVSVCIALVISLELLNSAIERLCDLVMPQQHPDIKYIKDVCAGAVLIVCCLSLVVAAIVFGPYLLRFFS